MEKLLKIYTYVDGVNDTPFPNADAQIEIFRFNYDAKRMGGAPTISASVMYKYCLDKLWTGKEYVIYNGERYKLKQTPTSSKNNTDARYKHDLELVALRVVLDYVYFFDAVVENTPVDDKPVTNSTKVVFSGDIHEFAKHLNASLKYTKLDYSVVVDDGITSETKFLSFDAQPISSVLQEIYKQYEIPYYFVGNVIHIGFTSNAITKTFKYGANDALLSISKNNANNKIVNRCTGVGSEENIPYYYPNKHPLGIVDTYLNDELNNALVTNNEKFGAKVKNGTELTYTENKIEDLVSSLEIYNYETYFGYIRTYGTPIPSWSWFTITDFIYNDIYDLAGKAEFGSYKAFNQLSEKITFTAENPIVSIKVKFNYLLEKLNVDTVIDIIANLSFPSGRITYTKKIYIPVLSQTDKTTILFVEPDQDTPLNKQNMGSFDYVYVVLEIGSGVRFDKNTLSRSAELELTATTKEPFYNYAWKNESDKIVKLENYGLTFNGTPSVGDKITFQPREGSLIPFQNALMPPIYWQTKGEESFYNAINDTYISPETGKYYSFENEYSDENRREHKETFDYIKPSMEFVRNGDTLPINMFLEFAYDENDNDEIDELTNEYIHPYFFAKLRKFNGENGFNLFDHANEKGEMTISMTSGNCGACNFVIGVSENTKKNIVQVDDSGNLVYESGRVKFGAPQDKQNDTINNEVWIALKKDTQTFGMLLPNKSIYPKPCTSADTNDGDTFVITNISLPTSFIREAEERLKDEIIKYMKLNNSEKFTFSIKFSRIYLAENPNILAQLNENARIQIEYNGATYELYVSSYQYKVVNNEILPEITVELADTLTQNENALQQAINAVEHSIMSSVGSIDFYKQGLKYFVRKDVEDYVRGLLHLTKGATFGANDIAKVDEQGNADFVSQIIRQYISTPQFIDGFAGVGFKLWLDENGKSNLTVDNLTARETFRVFEMLVTKLRAVNGGLFVSAANGTIKEVVDSGEYYDIILENDNTFVAGDYMRCQVMSGLKLMDYWVEVASTNGKTCRVLKSEFGSAMPLVGQDVVLDGSKNKGRQNAIHISATEDGQPRIDILNEIATKSHDNCLCARLGNLDGIYDELFGENQPHGDGLYSDNAYLKGEFIVKSRNESVDTMFAVQEGKIQSSVASLQDEAIRGKTFLKNASFAEGLRYWVSSNEDSLYMLDDSVLFEGNSAVYDSVNVSDKPIFDDIHLLTINNGSIRQARYNFVDDASEYDNEKEYPLVFSVNARVRVDGTLVVKVGGKEIVRKDLTVNEEFVTIDVNSTWYGTGDFSMSFSGVADFYGICLYTETTEKKYRTFFEQSDRLIKFGATELNPDGTVSAESGIMTKPKGNEIYVFDGKSGEYKVLGYFGTDEENKTKIVLSGENIQLDGNITANGKVEIVDGKIKADEATFNNGVFEGKITSKEGSIGGFEVTKDGLTYSSGSYKAEFKKETINIGDTNEYAGTEVSYNRLNIAGKADVSSTGDADKDIVLNVKKKRINYNIEEADFSPVVNIENNSNGYAIAADIKGALRLNGGFLNLGKSINFSNTDTSNAKYLPIEDANFLYVWSERANGGAYLYIPKLEELRKILNTGTESFFFTFDIMCDMWSNAFYLLHEEPNSKIYNSKGDSFTQLYIQKGESYKVIVRSNGSSLWAIAINYHS